MRQLSYVIALFAIGSCFAMLMAPGCFPFSYESSGGGETTTTTSTGGALGGIPCSSTSICEDVDRNPCTQEACMNDVCVVTLLTMNKGPGSSPCKIITCNNGVSATETHEGSACGMGLTCTAQGDCFGCTTTEQCGKTDECQTSTCKMGMKCEYTYQPRGTPVSQDELPGDCMGTICNGSGEKELRVDDSDAPAVSAVCIEGHCSDGKPMQINSVVGKPCADGVTFCNAFQSCVVCAIDSNCPMGTTCAQDQKQCVGCFDGAQNNGEIGIDCGGPCALKCVDGTPCSKGTDCAHGQCMDGVCCAVACGDPCSACNLPMKEGTCAQLPKGTDDAAPLCSGMMTCDAGTCVSDGGKKHAGQPCSSAAQCFSGVCAGTPLKCD